MSNLNERTGPSLSSAGLKATDGILATWGVFTLLELGGGLNFLPENALQEVSKLGVKITIGNRGLQWPKAAEYADQLIGQLGKYKPKWAQAVKWHYTEPGSIRDQAGAHGLRKSTYHERLDEGRTWIAERLKQTLH